MIESGRRRAGGDSAIEVERAAWVHRFIERPVAPGHKGAGLKKMRAFAKGDVVGGLPELVQPVARSDAAHGGQRVALVEGGRPVVARSFRNARDADQIADVELRLVGGA